MDIDTYGIRMDNIGMDEFTQRHFEEWLGRTICAGGRDATRAMIIDLLEDDPGLLDSHSWTELRNMAEEERWL